MPKSKNTVWVAVKSPRGKHEHNGKTYRFGEAFELTEDKKTAALLKAGIVGYVAPPEQEEQPPEELDNDSDD